MSKLMLSKMKTKNDTPVFFSEILNFIINKKKRDFDYNAWKKEGNHIAAVGATCYLEKKNESVFLFLVVSGKDEAKNDFETMIADFDKIYSGKETKVREALCEILDRKYQNLEIIKTGIIDDSVRERSDNCRKLSDLFISEITGNKGVIIFNNSNFEYLLDSNNNIIDKKSVSFTDIIKNKQNKDTLSENIYEESIFGKVILEKFNIEKEHEHYYEIENFITMFFDENKSGFRYEILKNDLDYDHKSGDMVSVVYKGDDLVGLVNQSNYSHEPHVSWKIFNKKIFEETLVTLIEKSKIEEFINDLMKDKEKRKIVSYCDVEEFEENPLKFIEENTAYYYKK